MNISSVINSIKNPKIKQAIVLYSSTIGAMLIGFLISVVNTKYLGKDDFGNFKFIEVLFSLIILFSSFGFFYSCTYLTAKEQSEQKRNSLFGAHIVLALFVALFLVIILVVYTSFFYQGELAKYIYMLLPFAIVLVFNNSLENLLQGNNKINLLSFLKIGPKMLYVLMLCGLIFFYDTITLKEALIFFYASIGLVIIIIIVKTNFSFANLIPNIKEIIKANRNVGLPIYVGGIFGVATTHLSSLLISYFNNNTDFGFYTLALTISSPMGVLPAIVGTTLMRDFAAIKKIPTRFLRAIVFVAVVFFVVFLLVLKPVFNYFYSEDYSPAISLAVITSIGFLIHGFGDLFNKFLYAKGEGRKMRLSSINIGISNLIFSLSLIPVFGAAGAAYVKIISATVYLGTVYYFYSRKMN